jgi:hypothetical protein
MMRAIREHSTTQAAYQRKPAEERDPLAIVRGIFHDEAEKPEYSALYQQLVDKEMQEAEAS